MLSAGWLHGGVLHIVFNMLWVRDLVPPLAHLYGAARAVIIYTVAGVCAASLASSFMGAFLPFLPRIYESDAARASRSAPRHRSSA